MLIWRSPRYELGIRDTSNKQVQKCKYVESALTEGRKLDNEIRRRIRIIKYAFKN